MGSGLFSPRGDWVAISDNKGQTLGAEPIPLGYKHDGRPGNVSPRKMRLYRATFNIGAETFSSHDGDGVMPNAIGRLSGVAFNIGVGTLSSLDNWAPSSRHV